MPSSQTLPTLGKLFSPLAAALDPRSAPRFAWLLLGTILAAGRRTVTRWIRAAGLADEYRCCYTTLAAVGARTDEAAARLLHHDIKPLLNNESRIVMGLDDTPTERYGSHIEGAGIHHNPTPGPAGSKYLYGHVWVTLALLVPHPIWKTIALPLLARLYVREKNLASIPVASRPAFRTKLEMAVELVQWATIHLKMLGKPLWLVADGAYAKAAVLKPLKELGVIVVSRLRKDSALFSVPKPRRAGERGRPRIYGENRIVLSKRAGQKGGWTTENLILYGKTVCKKYKSFLATWPPAGGVIRVVLVDEPTGWVAFFCTEANATPADILKLVADRFSIEICFRDLKDVVGAGQQQVRDLRTNVGAFHACVWSFTAVEAWAWNRKGSELTDHRSASPWDGSDRRPSHADKRRAFRRELLGEEIRSALRSGSNNAKIPALTERLLSLAG
jgi:hypothetical protein